MENVRLRAKYSSFEGKESKGLLEEEDLLFFLSFSLLLLLLSLGKLSGKGRYYLFYLIIFLENSLSSREEWACEGYVARRCVETSRLEGGGGGWKDGAQFSRDS